VFRTSKNKQRARRYSLIGPSAERAVEQGLAAAEWYHTEIPRQQMKELMKRSNGPALRDTAIWLTLLIATGVAGCLFWGSWICIPFLLCYGVLYASASGSRWHESNHGTAFKTPWLNDALYYLSSFMNLKEPTYWRWSHARHHTDTIIAGRDREIAAMRPPDALRLIANVIGLTDFATVFPSLMRHAVGSLTEEEMTFIPPSEIRRVTLEARIFLGIYALVVAFAIVIGSWLPVVLIILPTVYGRWLASIVSLTEHAGLAENVLDHRLNSRTVLANPFMRFIQSNMNFHVEHHMFPMVPYHALPQLHALLRDDMPAPSPSLLGAYREILPALRRQWRDPGYHLVRELPPTARAFRPELHKTGIRVMTEVGTKEWVDVCGVEEVEVEDVAPFDFNGRAFAIFRTPEGDFYATDGVCTHEHAYLADGLVVGNTIECPKHNGRFDYRSGEAKRAPVCVDLRTYPVRVRADRVQILLG
jgi:Na+-transporting NADH:ubiquinone oxidoreductase subunit F